MWGFLLAGVVVAAFVAMLVVIDRRHRRSGPSTDTDRPHGSLPPGGAYRSRDDKPPP
jgi:hypothetical protein